jgi:hypothetical protein
MNRQLRRHTTTKAISNEMYKKSVKNTRIVLDWCVRMCVPSVIGFIVKHLKPLLAGTHCRYDPLG